MKSTTTKFTLMKNSHRAQPGRVALLMVILSLTAFASVVLLIGGSAAQSAYVDESIPTQSLEDNQAQSLMDNLAQPLALASADFDEDGVPDLAVGYAATNGGGLISIQRGNIDSLFPYGEALRNGKPPAFLPDPRIFTLPESPDFLGVGDFDADGHWDVVAAKRGSSSLYFLRGDESGGLRAAQRTELFGRVTALTTGEINRADGLTDIVVGIDGTDGPDSAKALVFESPEGAMKATREVFALPAAAASFSLGQFAGDYQNDLAIAAGDNLLIVGGRDRKLSLGEAPLQQIELAVITSRSMPFSINAMVAGNFNGDFEGDLALAAPDGRIFLLTPPKVAVERSETTAAQVAVPATDGSSSPASAPAVVSLIKDSAPAFVAETDRPLGDWLLSEVEGSSPSDPSLMQGRLILIRARVSGAANDDLMALGGEHTQLRLMNTGTDKRARRAAVAAAIAAEVEPVAVLPMRLNPDGISDLVILKKGATEPSVVMSAAAKVFTVNTANDADDGVCNAAHCSLREAVTRANNNPGADMIVFNIPGTGVHTITPRVELGFITDPVTIDGYSQPGASPNTLGNGDNAVLKIELNGEVAQQGSSGFFLFNTPNSVIRGFAIGGFRFRQLPDFQAGGFGIVLAGQSGFSDNNFVEGCFIGTNAAGTVARPNTNGGVFVFSYSDNNTFGGTFPAARNLLSGNGRSGRGELDVSSGGSDFTTGTKVLGNFIGTDITGTEPLLFSGVGVFFFNARNSIIGGTTAGSRNIISGKPTGISFHAEGNPTHAMPGTLVQGNLIGLDVNGDNLGNSVGMDYGAVFHTTLGGTTPAAANTLSANAGYGIFLGTNATNNVIQGNFIGTNAAGANKSNGLDGISIDRARRNNFIGGGVPGAGNVIAFNGQDGISTIADSLSFGSTIRGNSIHSNAQMGIDLADNGVTPNDACDADTGANELQNFPVLTNVPSGNIFVTATATNSTGNTSEFSRCVRAQMSGGNVVVQGTMDSKASGTFILDFYSNTACDPSGNGEGQTYLGSATVTTNVSCNGIINVTPAPPTPTPTPTPAPTPLVGEKIAFTSNRDGNNEIYVMRPTGADVTRLTVNEASDNRPSVSGDGARIAFTSFRDDNNEIYVMNAGDGSNQIRISNNPSNDSEPSFSGDGTRIAFTSRRNGNSEIYVMNADGSNQTRLTNESTEDTEPSFSRDGTRITFMAQRDGNSEIYVMNANGSNQTRLTNNTSIDGSPTFSPDGTRIAFDRFDTGDFQIFVMNANGTNQVNLSNNAVSNQEPSFSPDGTRIAYQRSNFSSPEIYVMNADGSNKVNITNRAGSDSEASWGPGAVTPTVQFSSASFNVTEGCVPATLTVTLAGSPTGTVAVDYTVNEGTAKQKTDYTYVAGTVLPQKSAGPDTNEPLGGSAGDSLPNGSIIFAEGETTKEITVLISEDGFAEGTENLSATLSNPRGASLGGVTTTTLNINDNETVNSATNPIDNAPTYVCQLYHDFLHRQPDTGGQTFWTNEITQCGANQACVSERRHNVAAAFFLSIEFQQTGYFVYRAYETGLDRRPQYEEFMRALNAIGLGVEVLIGDWEQRLAAQRSAFAELMVQTSEFKALFPDGMTGEQFADKLFSNAGATPSQAERNALIFAYGAGNTPERAAALMLALDSGSIYNRLYNSGFVLIEYFGFMRRDPQDPPDTNLDGFNFWIEKMDDHTQPGEDTRIEATAFARIKRAEMIRAFIISDEYRGRFGQP